MGVYKEGKNWKVQVYYKDWQGNQKRKQKRGFRTKGEAKEWERDFLQQQSQGVDIEFGNFLEIYYKDMDVRLREHTMYTKRYIIDLKIRPYFEKKILSEITVADVRAWQNELLMYKDKNGNLTITEHMGKAYSEWKLKQDKEPVSEIDKKYQKLLETLSQEQEEVITEYCNAIFSSGAETEEFFYRLGLKDGLNLKNTVKSVLEMIS